jgi:hypothetical protein
MHVVHFTHCWWLKPSRPSHPSHQSHPFCTSHALDGRGASHALFPRYPDDDVYAPGGAASAMAAKHRLAVYFPLLRRREAHELAWRLRSSETPAVSTNRDRGVAACGTFFASAASVRNSPPWAGPGPTTRLRSGARHQTCPRGTFWTRNIAFACCCRSVGYQ